MTSAEESRSAYSIGWVTSLCLHASMVCGAFVLTQHMTLGPQPVPFRWNVAMVALPFGPLPPSPVPLTAMERPPVDNPSSPTPPVSANSSKAEMVESARQAPHADVMVRRYEAPAVLQGSPSMQESEQPSAVETAISPPTPVIASTSSPPEPAQVPMKQPEGVSPAETSNTSPVVSSGSRPDYSWLSEIIMRRMQELKRYPAEARLNRAEGKVVLKAVIRNDGRIEGIEVFQSSGHESLDRAAIELLELAAPFHFPRPLERPQMTVKIPMNYRLE